MKQVWFWDIEVFPNFFCVTFKSKDTKEVRFFSIYGGAGEIKVMSCYNNVTGLLKFIDEEVSGLIGFNSINYDNPVFEFIINKLRTNNWGDVITFCANIYNKSQEVINTQFPAIRNPKIYQLDLYKIWHFDNKAKATSLKAVEAAIRFDNVEDLPYSFDKELSIIETLSVRDYNLNDVNATEAFYYVTIGQTENKLYKGDDKIQLRKDIQAQFDISCINYNDGKIGEELAKKSYLQLSGRDWYDIKNSSTERKWINIKDLIPSYIRFESLELIAFLEEIRDKSFMTHEKFKRKIEFAGNTFEFAKGGLHSEDKPGLFKPEEGEILADYDVALI